MQFAVRAYAAGVASAAVITILSSCAPSTTPRAQRIGTVGLSLAGWATLRIPRHWHVTPLNGQPATVYFPLDVVSTQRLAPTCRDTGSRTPGNWCAIGWTVPPGGVIILWSHAEFPTGAALATIAGRAATIDGRPAKVRAGPATSACPSGAAVELDADVSASDRTGDRFDMTACFGPRVSRQDRASVIAMLRSLRRSYRS